jgi:hypothetical protein
MLPVAVWPKADSPNGTAMAPSMSERRAIVVIVSLELPRRATYTEERTRERVELDWATTQECLAATLLMAGRRRNDPGILEEALVSIDGALEVYRQVNAEFWQDEAENLRSVILALLDGELPT